MELLHNFENGQTISITEQGSDRIFHGTVLPMFYFVRLTKLSGNLDFF